MAIPLFIKVRPFVARKLKLESERFKTADGNYILWPLDFAVFGPPYRLAEYAAKVGGVILSDADAAANHRGEINTPLPDPEDPEWTAPEDDTENLNEENVVVAVEDTDSAVDKIEPMQAGEGEIDD